MAQPKSSILIKGIGEKFKLELEKLQILTNEQFLNATKDKVDSFNPRLKRIWGQEQLKTGKNNVAAGLESVQQAQCEVTVFQTTKRTVAEVSEDVLKAQDACKTVLPDHVAKNAWKKFTDKQIEENKRMNETYFKDGKPVNALAKDAYVIISSSTVPVWLCDSKGWQTLFGKSDIFKGSGPSEVFSDTIGALFFALTHDKDVPPPDQMSYLSMQLEHLMTRYKMPFLKLLTEHYEDMCVAKGSEEFKKDWLDDAKVTLFLAKHNLSYGDKPSDISVLFKNTLRIEDMAHFWRLAVDRKIDLDPIRKAISDKGKGNDLMLELCKTAPEDSKKGRRNFCEDVLALDGSGAFYDISSLPKEIQDAIPSIIFEERGPISRMFSKLQIQFTNIQPKDKDAFAALVVECVIDTDSAREVKVIDDKGESMKKVFDLVKDEPMKKLLLSNLLITYYGGNAEVEKARQSFEPKAPAAAPF
jgi:hypothetical protein